jgi:membrane-associated phospholipid phosphatase
MTKDGQSAQSKPAGTSRPLLALRPSLFRHYLFVDYATQGYSALAGLLILLFHNETITGWPWLGGAHAAGLLLVHGLIQWHARGQPGKVLDFFRHFYPVLLYTGFFRETGAINRIFFTDYLDPTVIRWEQALFGAQPSVLFMDRFPYLWVSELFYASYFSYYLMITGVGITLFVRDRRQFFHFVSVVSFLFYVCYAIYDVVPVIGPRVFFREIEGYTLPKEFQQLASTDLYPASIKTGVFFHVMALIYHVFEAPGAALPSSHVAVALCTVYFSFRYLRPIRYVHLTAAILLCFSTVYCRYHYVVDVLAGLVTAALLIPLGNWLYFKFRTPNSE